MKAKQRKNVKNSPQHNKFIAKIGNTSPLGSYFVNGGVNFALFSENATACTLCLFENGKEYRFPMHRTENIWHIFIANAFVGIEYGFRVDGIADKQKGALFNPNKLLLDPYAKLNKGKPDASNVEKQQWFVWNDPRDNALYAPKSVVINDKFDWSDENRPHYRWAESIIYELHVKGFSKFNPDIPAEIAGTYAGLAHSASIQHLKRLGITAVELQPVSYRVDEVHLQRMGLTNYWGYSTIGHSAIEIDLAADKCNPLTEFKQMVKTLHQNGIEVILDVVYNHTGEGGKNDLMLCQRGIDNQSYYWLTEQGEYHNWTGCGNALNLSHPQVCQWAIDSLKFWVEECHIDGFRFDLATTLGRTPDFSPFANFFERLRSDPVFAQTKFIAEPWDIGFEGYQVGQFPQHFAEWNDKYRTQIRDFFLRESGNLGEFSRRLAGSDDLYQRYSPAKSINYFASHDGFTLQDLVSYSKKHNWANGEENRDGDDHNHSNNHGVEGATDNSFVNILRDQTAKAMLATLFLSNGTPMLLSGDEMGRTQQGNNNSYCQDNKITWLDWQNANQERIEYVANWIKLRKQIPLLSQNSSWWTTNDVQWFSSWGKPMTIGDWHDHSLKALQILIQDQWLVLINAKKATQDFLPPNGKWNLCLGEESITLMSDTQAVAIRMEQMGVCVLQRKQRTFDY